MALWWKTTIFGRVGKQGWSESLHRLNVGIGTGDRIQVEDDLRQLARFRAATCGLGVFLDGLRISYQDTVKKRSVAIGVDPMELGLKEFPVDPLTGYTDAVERSADQPTSSIQWRMYSADGRARNYWMCGIPDMVIRENPEGVTVVNSATWKAKLDIWKAELLSGRWGFKARTLSSTDPYIPIVGLFKQPVGLGLVGAVVAGAATISRPNQLQLRGCKPLSRLVPSITGVYTIDSIDATTSTGNTIYYLRGTENFDADAYDWIGSVQRVAYEAVAINELRIYRQGRHKRGRPFGQQVGRSAKPLRLPF